MISLKKLNTLPRKTRLRKVVLLLQAEERAAGMGGELHLQYLGDLCQLLARDESCGRQVVTAAEACGSLCAQSAFDPVTFPRQVNPLRHALLRYLGAEPAEWDLLAPAFEELDASARAILPIRVYLEEIRSPFNVGAIFRSAEAFGVCELLLSPTTASALHPRAVKSARGAVRIVPWRFAELKEIAELAEPTAAGDSKRQEGIFALELGGTPLEQFSFPEQGIMLVGSEELGLSPTSLALAACGAGRVSIPMAGAKRSLNVAVAVGIVLQAWQASITGRRNAPNATAGMKHTNAQHTATNGPAVP